MTEQIAALLNELMGTRRNADLGTNVSAHFDDPEICKAHLVDYCPNELFVNTKSDLGVCTLIHDDNLREQYKKSSRFTKLGYEKAFYNSLSRMKDDMSKKIVRNKERLAITQSKDENKKYVQRSELQSEIKNLHSEIDEASKKIESFGIQGNITKAQEMTDLVDRLVTKKGLLEKEIEAMIAPTDEQGNKQKQMEVCEVCSCFLVVADAESRITEHFQGKQHVGYAKINETLDELKKTYGDVLFSSKNDFRRERDDRKDYRDRDSKRGYDDRRDRNDRGYNRNNYDDRRGGDYDRNRRERDNNSYTRRRRSRSRS
uniref:U1 snRNP-associated protein Usp106 n=1 Tax=Rhabditophanes sp. KR3021 TaxID=114890 RepID=A0AC35TSS4_9BILA